MSEDKPPMCVLRTCYLSLLLVAGCSPQEDNPPSRVAVPSDETRIKDEDTKASMRNPPNAISEIKDIVVANDDADFDRLLRESAMIAKFLTQADSVRYSIKDERLIERIRETSETVLGTERANSHSFVGDDWWPDHTRHILTDTEVFDPPFFAALHGLLAGEFDEWRIQIVVSRDITKSGTEIGSVLLWKDKLIVDKALFDWMRDVGFDFPSSGKPRFFTLQHDDLSTPRYNLMNDPE